MRLPKPHTDWTPGQALAIYEWLQELANRFWDEYEDQILASSAQRQEHANHDQPDLFDFNDDLPF